MAAVWKLIKIVAGTLLALALAGTLLLLVASLGSKAEEWENSQQLYLRNRTSAPLQVELTVPRTAVTALSTDPAWQTSTKFNPDSNQVAVASCLALRGHRYQAAALAVHSQPDSVRVRLLIAPDSIFWIAAVGNGFHHSDPDERWLMRDGLYPVVSWRDQVGRRHHQAFPTAHWLDAMQQVADQRGRHSYELTHYVEYR